MKQETIEEIAKDFYTLETELNERIAFKRGYTECKERMYSDEEVVYFIHKFLKEHQPHLPYVTGGINMWFEQFKKK